MTWHFFAVLAATLAGAGAIISVNAYIEDRRRGKPQPDDLETLKEETDHAMVSNKSKKQGNLANLSATSDFE